MALPEERALAAQGTACWRPALAYREFVDNAGTMWRVWDTYPVAANTLRTVSPSFAGGWLTFESDTERRRLAPIPAGWEIATRQLMIHWCARAFQARPPDHHAIDAARSQDQNRARR